MAAAPGVASAARTPTPIRPALPRPPTLAVAVGGAIGTAARAGLGWALAPTAAAWPWSTFLANLLGAFLLAFAFGRADRGRGPSWMHHPGVASGALGAFTTFSALALESSRAPIGVALGYACATLVAGAAAAGFGWRAGRTGRGQRPVGTR